MAKLEPKALVKRAERAEQKRNAFGSLMRDVHGFAMPERDSWNAYGYGTDRMVQVYDGTAVVSTARFANRLQQALFPPQQRWARLTLPPELASDAAAQDVQKVLEKATSLLFAHVHVSNFDMTINEWAQDLAAGLGCLLIQPGRLTGRRSSAPLLRFQAVPNGMVAFDEGPFGAVEGVFFTQRMPARLVKRTYPDAETLPEAITRAEREDSEAEQELLQATYYDADEDVWRFEVLLRGAEPQCFVERSYRTCPWVVTRWTKAPGETYGRGPLTQALPDIRTANKLVELMLKIGSFAVGGVYTAVDDGVLNAANVRLVPGAIIPVRSNGGSFGPSLRGLEMPGNFQVNEVLLDRTQTRIRQVMFDDPLPPEVQVGLTATEVIERVRRFQQDTGAFGRLQTDAVTPIVRRIIDILEEAGAFAAEEYRGLMGLVQEDAVRIRAVSPLAQAQDQADVQAVMSFAAGVAPLGEFGGRMLAAGLSPERAGVYVAERTGVPHELIPSREETEQRRQAASEEAETAALLQSPAAAQVAGAVANAAVRPPAEGAP